MLLIVLVLLAVCEAVDWTVAANAPYFNGTGFTKFQHSDGFLVESKCTRAMGVPIYYWIEDANVYMCLDNCTSISTKCGLLGPIGTIDHAGTFAMGGNFMSVMPTGTTIDRQRDAYYMMYSIEDKEPQCAYEDANLGGIFYHAFTSPECTTVSSGILYAKLHCSGGDMYLDNYEDAECLNSVFQMDITTAFQSCDDDSVRDVKCSELPASLDDVSGHAFSQGSFTYTPFKYFDGSGYVNLVENTTTGDYDVYECTDSEYTDCVSSGFSEPAGETSKVNGAVYAATMSANLQRLLTLGPVNLRTEDVALVTLDAGGAVESIDYFFDFPFDTCIQDPISDVDYSHMKYTCGPNQTVVATLYKDAECAVTADSMVLPGYGMHICGPFVLDASASTIDVILNYSEDPEITIVAIVVAAISGVVILLGIIALIGILVVYFVGQIRERRQQKVHPVASGQPDEPVSRELQG